MRRRALLALGLFSLVACGEGAEASFFSDFLVEPIEARRAVVSFRTAEPTSCELEYGLAAAALDLRAEDPDMSPGELSLDHEVPVEDLMPGTTYHYVARAEDLGGVVRRSEVRTFTTLEATGGGELLDVALLSEGASVVSVSSNFGGAANGESWGADAAIDGSMASEWSSAGDGDDAFLLVDLGQEQRVAALGIRSRKMADGSAIILSVTFQLDGGDALGPLATPDPDQAYRLDLESPETARQVRMEVETSTGGNTGLKELQVFVETNP